MQPHPLCDAAVCTVLHCTHAQVAELATYPLALPQIERVRLATQAGHGLKADRHREVVQYYQVRRGSSTTR